MTISRTIDSPIRVGLISLGCAKNLVDSEIMLGTLLQEGFTLINEATEADVVIVNTCSFIDAAQEESVDTILESDAIREAHCRGQGLVVAGCLPQRFRDDLPKLMPEVDIFMGLDQVLDTPRLVREALNHRQQRLQRDGSGGAKRSSRPRAARSARRAPGPNPPRVEVTPQSKFVPDYETPRFRLTANHFAYVKIAEGCNHPCSFCAIPRIRGRYRSRAIHDIVEETRRLVGAGVREINLISQDSTFYGLDRRSRRSGSASSPEGFQAASRSLGAEGATLPRLLRELNAVPGEFWIRLLYTHPAHWTDELIATLADSEKVARYIDIPLQHIHENMLERMRRETTREHIETLIDRIRRGMPGIALRTTFIVGFPGETPACFESLLAFIRQARFERLGVFAYSSESGTRAAGMSGQIPDPVRRERRERALEVQSEVIREVSTARVGTTLRVLVERAAAATELRQVRGRSWEHGLIRQAGNELPPPRGPHAVARSDWDAPEIDGRVYVKGRPKAGEFASVRVVQSSGYDLVAEPALSPAQERKRRHRG